MQGYESSYRPDYSWDPGNGPDFARQGEGVEVKRSRPLMIALVALVALVVAVAAVGNQNVTDTIRDHVGNNGQDNFVDNLLSAVTQYQWRFSAPDSDTGHLWAASLAFIGAALLLTFVLVAITTRGRGGFGQLLIAVWISVVVATMLAAYVRATVIDQHELGIPFPATRAGWIFFGSYSPNAYTFAAGIGYGLVVALVAATVGTSARKTDLLGTTDPGHVPPGPAYEPPPAQRPAEPEQSWAAPVPGPMSNASPWSAQPDQQQTSAFERPAGATAPQRDERAEQPSEQQHDESQHTAVLPTVGESGAPSDRSGASDTTDSAADSNAQHTQQLPRDDDGR